jgi:hypothetical protein
MERHNMKRRFFFRNIALSTAGFYLLPAFTFTREDSSGQETDDMDMLFRNPPDSCGPWVMWYWMDGHVTREGITLDLEMLKRRGFRGAFCTGTDSGIPSGPVKPGSNAWWDVIKHTTREAERLGLELVFQNPEVFSDDKSTLIPPEYRKQQLVWSEMTLPVYRKVNVKLPQPAQKLKYYQDISILAFPAPVSEKQMVVDPESVIDLTSFVNRKGWLRWETAVTGNWTIVRIGYTPADGKPEIDFLRKDSTNWLFGNISSSFDQTITGKSLKGFFGLTRDSDHHKWCSGFEQSFSDRLKYSMKPWLLVLTGKVVGSRLKSDRFLTDFRHIQQELYAENFEKGWMDWCHQKGLKWYSVPSELFEPESLSQKNSLKDGDFKGMNGAKESLAVLLASSPLNDNPGGLKFSSDEFYSLGYSDLIISPFVHQPYQTGVPGMVTTSCGIGYGRNNTWSEGLSGLTKYLRRITFLMQMGSPVADLCVFRGDLFTEDSSRAFPFLPAEFPFETIDRDTLAHCRVDNGKILLPDGSIIHACMVPPAVSLLPQTLKLLTEMVEKGMVLVFSQKPAISYGLSDSEEEITRFSNRLFGDLDGETNKKHDPGKGKVYLGVQIHEILDQLSVPVDFTYSSGNQDAALRFIHRKTGESHIYCLFNLRNRAEKINCTFRINHLKPEIWNCNTGEIIPAPIYSIKDGRLRMPLEIQPMGSVFIVFKKQFGISSFKKVTKDGNLLMDNEPLKYKGSARYAVETEHADQDNPGIASGFPLSFHPHPDGSIKALFYRNGVYNFQVYNESVEENLTVYVENCFTVPLDSSWVIQFPDGSGAPKEISPDKPESLTRHPDFNVRHFSGTCVCKTVFYLTDSDFISGRKFLIDLGEVGLIARVTVNGQDAGLLWEKPFVADITTLVRKGENILKVDVTNSWHNRMTGDENLPPENEYNQDGTIVTLPDWYTGNLPKPGERKTFTVRKCVSKDDPLFDSGLLGPVKLIFCEERFI